jgi:hypothetical protein
MADNGNPPNSRGRLYALLALLAVGAVVLAVYLVGRTSRTAAPPQPKVATSNVVAPVPQPAQEQADTLRTLPPSEQAARAFQAAFGRKNAVTLKSGQNREATKFTPGKLVWAPFGPVLLSEGNVLDASHASAGQLAAIYLKPNGTGFAAEKKFIPAVESGSFGSLSEWSVSLNLSSNPVVYVEGGGTWQGYTCSVATLLELAPNAPVEIAQIPVYYSNAGTITDNSKPTELKGRIANVVEGQSFDVSYSGSRRFTDHYVRRGAKYMLKGARSQMQEC